MSYICFIVCMVNNSSVVGYIICINLESCCFLHSCGLFSDTLIYFTGVYLPLLWEKSFCWKTPIALGYTRGHFSALVPMEMDSDDAIGAGANIESNEDSQMAYLPLVDNEGKLLPVHFLTRSEVCRNQ